MLVVGSLSGTSMNAKEFLLCEIDESYDIRPLEYFSESYSKEEREMLEKIALYGADTSLISLAHDVVGLSFARSLREFSRYLGDYKVIGFHGQTVFHREFGGGESLSRCRRELKATTLQIGEPLFLSRVSGRPVVYDFRKSDIAAGGRGAPLSPLVHYMLFRKHGKRVCVVNLGGIANITVIEGDDFSRVRGFDICPANALSDFLAKRKLGIRFDPKGRYAQMGKINERAFNKIYNLFRRRRKRTLGAEVEEAKVISEKILKRENPQNSIRTVLEVSVKLLSEAIKREKPSVVVLCGGGVRNEFFVKRIKEESRTAVVVSDELGVKAEHIEPMLFALLAYMRIRDERVNMKNITGARLPYLPGKICAL